MFPVFILSKRSQKNVFDEFQGKGKKKSLFRLWKQEVKKVEKLALFQRGVHGFGEKFEIFSCYFCQDRPEKCVLRYSRKEKRLFTIREQEVKKVAFFKKRLVHGLGQKFEIFPFFLVKM